MTASVFVVRLIIPESMTQTPDLQKTSHGPREVFGLLMNHRRHRHRAEARNRAQTLCNKTDSKGRRRTYRFLVLKQIVFDLGTNVTF